MLSKKHKTRDRTQNLFFGNNLFTRVSLYKLIYTKLLQNPAKVTRRLEKM